MAEVKLRALGLREVDFGDFDRYLTALTEDGRRIEIPVSYTHLTLPTTSRV